MTALPASRDAALLAIVNRCRARAGLVSFVRSSTMACAVTLTVAVVTRLLWSGDSNVAVWMALAVAIGIGGGAAMAVLRYPSSRQVAGHIDRHLHLEDSVVAALQMQDSSAPVGPLILRQALDRAGTVHAAAVFPFELRRPAAMLAAALLLVVATLLRSDNQSLASDGDRAISTADTGGGDAAAARAGAPPGTTAQPGSRTIAARTAETTASGEPRPAEAAASQQPQTTSQQDATGRGSARAADSSREAPALAQASGGSDARGGAGSAGSGPARGAGSGGVRSGTLIPSATAVTQTTPAQQPASGYQQAQRRAEAALTRGDIPPELRSYVREYFRAISR